VPPRRGPKLEVLRDSHARANAAPGTNQMLCPECAMRPADERRAPPSATDAQVCWRCGASFPAGDGTARLQRFGLDPDATPLFEVTRGEH